MLSQHGARAEVVWTYCCTLVIFLPLAGARAGLAAARPTGRRAAGPGLGRPPCATGHAVQHAAHGRRGVVGGGAAAVAAAVRELRPAAGGFQFQTNLPWIPAIGVELPRRRRRHQPAAGGAECAADASWRCLSPGTSTLRPKEYFALRPGPGDGRRRRVHVARLVPLLPLLGARAGADVPAHRHLGRPAARVRGDEVLDLHGARRRLHARRHSGALLCCRAAAVSTCSRSAAAQLRAARCQLAAFVLLFVGVRGQDPRSSRSTPGCPTRTSRRRRRSACCWPACC